jgi:hypothetical protein
VDHIKRACAYFAARAHVLRTQWSIFLGQAVYAARSVLGTRFFLEERLQYFLEPQNPRTQIFSNFWSFWINDPKSARILILTWILPAIVTDNGDRISSGSRSLSFAEHKRRLICCLAPEFALVESATSCPCGAARPVRSQGCRHQRKQIKPAGPGPLPKAVWTFFLWVL